MNQENPEKQCSKIISLTCYVYLNACFSLHVHVCVQQKLLNAVAQLVER